MRAVQRISQSGVTLVELVISIVILGIAATALLSSFSLSINQSADTLWRNKTLKLAQLYLDEILAQPYDEATPVGGLPPVDGTSCDNSAEGGETRQTYDDVGDYNNVTNESPPQSLSGNLTGYDNYSVTVTITCEGDTVGAGGANQANQAKRIEVAITSPSNETMIISAYRGNF